MTIIKIVNKSKCLLDYDAIQILRLRHRFA